MNGQLITVSQLNRYVKSVFDSDYNLKSVFVSGEISNLKINSFSGHMYFTLKDEGAAVKAVMFKTSVARLKFIPQEGMKVICRAGVTLYERDGAYQLYVTDIQPDGAGSIAIAFEQLKEKLASEGLFDETRKKPLPPFPKKIAIITSETGAAVQDMISVIGRRWPLATLVMCPVKVQGEGSAEQMCDALLKVNNATDCDVIIIGRGGGSAEDLWCFNDENLARCIASSNIPVISAVGHETDFTICDFAADKRAATPSAAAELCVPDITEIMLGVIGAKQRLDIYIKSCFDTLNNKYQNLASRKALTNKFDTIDRLSLNLDNLKHRLDVSFNDKTSTAVNKLSEYTAKLDALNPAKILLRGYSITEKQGRTVKSIEDLSIDDIVKIKLSDGIANCKVISTEE
ncbi:MAG: exodeoxyribonuclease VII large subunit [Clostridia bacterium]|nr:exodeoxyribonuclease VII large subunit [Clostridia bacterium]